MQRNHLRILSYFLIFLPMSILSNYVDSSDTCNGYYFQEFSIYPHNETSFFDCDKKESSSTCATKCISKSSDCASFVVDFKHKRCYTITSRNLVPEYDPLHHSYLHCTDKGCPTCEGFMFEPNTMVQTQHVNAIITQQVESGWCAKATKSLPGAAFTVSQHSNLCDVIPNEWTLAPSDTQNAFYPCSSINTTMSQISTVSKLASDGFSQTSQNNISCSNKADGAYPNTDQQPPCQFFYICAAGEILLQGSCEYPLIFGTNLGACDIPGIATCNALASPPPPQLPTSLNFSTGLDTSSTTGKLRVDTQTHMNKESRYISFDEEKLPQSVDWSPLFNFVREQRRDCGGCWAYSAVDAIQAAQMIALGLDSSVYTERPLSVNQLLFCSGNLSSCNGGWPEDALEYAATVGSLFLDNNWNNSCPISNSAGTLATRPVLSWERVPANDPVSLKKALANQPVIVGISTEGRLQEWNSDVIYDGRHMGSACTLQKVDHNLLLVGYTEKYWLARNSWGTQWGSNGYIKIKMTDSLDSGICNMMSIDPIYPVVSPNNKTISKKHELKYSLRRPVKGDENTAAELTEAKEVSRTLAAGGTCQGYAFQENMMYSYSPMSFFNCPSSDSSTVCASKCIQNAPNCTDFVLDISVNKCYAVLNYITTYNSSFHAYLQCLDPSCSYCNGYRFFPGVLLSPLSGYQTTQPLDTAGCASYCQSSNCTAFNVDQTSNSCSIIYDSGSSSYAPYNSYFSCAASSYSTSISSSSFRSSSSSSSPGLSYYCPSMLALCGSGTCNPNPYFPGGYVCRCPDGMIPSTDSFGLSICISANACTGKTFNPCGIGACSSTSYGEYTCQCPTGYFPDYNALHLQTCTSKIQYALTDVGYYTSVPSSQDCNFVSSLTGLGLKTLALMNKDLPCDSYGGKIVVVGPSVDSGNTNCGTLYQLSSMSDTCTSVRSMFGLSTSQFASLNPSICSNATSCICRARSSVCVEAGQSTAVGYPCSSYDTIFPGEGCSSIMARNNLSAFSFFMLNPGIDCDALTSGDKVCNSSYAPSYVTSYYSRRKLLQGCPCQHGCFTVQNGNTCINLANTYYRCSIRLLQYWNGLAYQGFVCVDSQLIPGRTVLCYPANPGGC